MAKSKTSKQHKAYTKAKNLKKQKQREMANEAKNQPITFVYNKDKETVEVPIKAWQTLNQAAQQLQNIAIFVSTMEIVGQQHMQDGTLLPVFNDDLEISSAKNPDGSPQMKIKDSFWNKGSKGPVTTAKTTEEVVKENIPVFQAEGKYEEEKATLEMPSTTVS